jgi:acyl carrier protein
MPTREKIRQFIVDELIPDGSGAELTDTLHLIESGVIDSFGIMSLLGFLEENFSIQISGDDLMPDNFSSISTICDFVTQKST